MNSAIILAAGDSFRFNSHTPKQFHQLNGRILLDYPVQTFSECSEIDQLIIVVPKERLTTIQAKYPSHKVVAGGTSRRESSYNGLKACPPDTVKVLIHDAARALVDNATILRCLNELKNAEAVSTVMPTKDTVVEANKNIILSMPDRDLMFLEQTPQGFHFQTLLDAHRKITAETTDDIRLVKEMGIECKTVEGSENNFKITTLKDFQFAEMLLKESI